MRKKKRKKRQIDTKSDPTTIHASPRKKKDVKMNLTMGEIMIQIIEASCTRCSKAANTCRHASRFSSLFFFICTKAKIPLVLNNTNKKILRNHNQTPKIRTKKFKLQV
jgi:hypothetical protein